MRILGMAALLVGLAGSTAGEAQVAPAGELELVTGTGAVVGTLVALEENRMTVSVVAPSGEVGILFVDEQGLTGLPLIAFEKPDCSGQAYAVGIYYAGVAGFSKNGISLWGLSGGPAVVLASVSVFTEEGTCIRPPIGNLVATPVVVVAEGIDSEFIPPFLLQQASSGLEPSVLAVPSANWLGLLALAGLLAIVGAGFVART